MGKDVIGNLDGVDSILRILRNRFAPDRIDCIFQDIQKFSHLTRTTQDMDTYLLEFEMLRQKAEARFDMGTGFPDEFASVLCIQNAALSKTEKQLVVASVGSSLVFGNVAAQMRRLFGNMGSSQNMDVLVTQDVDQASDEDDFEAWVAYRKAKRAKNNMGDAGSRDLGSKYGKGTMKNAVNYRTGEINRCFVCNSEYHYAPQCPRKGGKPGAYPQQTIGKKKSPSKPYSSIALETPVTENYSPENTQLPPDSIEGNSFSTTIDLGGEFVVSRASSVVVLDTGATANLVCRSWLVNRNLFLERLGMEKVHPYPSAARFKFGDGRIGEVQYAANISVGIAGCKGGCGDSGIIAKGRTRGFRRAIGFRGRYAFVGATRYLRPSWPECDGPLYYERGGIW